MKKLILVIVATVILFLPEFAQAEVVNDDVKVAFFRDGHLWTKINGKEEQVTEEPAQFPYPPQWSHDGKWIMYQKDVIATINDCKKVQSEIWVYSVAEKKHQKIFYDGFGPKWSPKENIIAFQSRGVLNISDLDKFYNIALGVDDFNWFPDGKGFIASSGASLRPDGWTNPILYKISLKEDFKNLTSLMENAKRFYTIPKELSKDSASVMSINATTFEFSPDHKWISFIVSPTGSMSMDSNMLCVINTDGKDFGVIDEMILNLDNPKWADQKNMLGYIAGGGRIVDGFKNKDMKVTEIPSNQSLNLTPASQAELGFTWVNDNSLIVSRVPESEWSNDPKERPKPSLYLINIIGQEQTKITNPPADLGDYLPNYVPALKKVAWLRKTEANESSYLWIADRDGKNAQVWIKDISISGYAVYPY
ncbi:TolB family protein [Bacillus canaveralius]|uniref:TolB family protein n=1 Tax=Bacillus canaveralius TaxID=1403243 RepID=UPI000F7B15B5|nr:TolB domain-containing protein [Bacillus canaveralius]RSK53980.1 TolB domain-containing protein [Bacillus canaveralius]